MKSCSPECHLFIPTDKSTTLFPRLRLVLPAVTICGRRNLLLRTTGPTSFTVCSQFLEISCHLVSQKDSWLISKYSHAFKQRSVLGQLSWVEDGRRQQIMQKITQTQVYAIYINLLSLIHLGSPLSNNPKLDRPWRFWAVTTMPNMLLPQVLGKTKGKQKGTGSTLRMLYFIGFSHPLAHAFLNFKLFLYRSPAPEVPPVGPRRPVPWPERGKLRHNGETESLIVWAQSKHHLSPYVSITTMIGMVIKTWKPCTIQLWLCIWMLDFATLAEPHWTMTLTCTTWSNGSLHGSHLEEQHMYICLSLSL